MFLNHFPSLDGWCTNGGSSKNGSVLDFNVPKIESAFDFERSEAYESYIQFPNEQALKTNKTSSPDSQLKQSSFAILILPRR